MTHSDDTPRIYVACLAAYNSGKLHGAWIDATRNLEDIQAEVRAMLETSPQPDAEEYAIHDYEGFEGARIEEYTSLETVHELAVFIEEHGMLGAKLLEHHDGDQDAARRQLEDGYCGQWESAAAYAQDMTEQTTEIPERLAAYIDYDGMARDMELNGDIFTIETAHEEVHIFLNL